MSEQRATVGFILLASVIVSLIVLQGVRANPEPTPTPTPTAKPRQTHAQNNPEPSRTERAERVARSTARPQPAPVRVKGKAQRYAAALVSETQMRCLVPLWQRESGWSACPGVGFGAVFVPILAFFVPGDTPGKVFCPKGSQVSDTCAIVDP